MPQAGYLLFFYEAEEQQTWGFDPADRGSWQVRYVTNTTGTFPTTAPSRVDALQFGRKNISFHRSNSRPSWERLVLPRDRIEYGTDKWNELSDYLDDQLDQQLNGSPAHQLFGLPIPQQGDSMELECQLASNGLYVGNSTGYDDPRRTSLELGAADWHLLLQIDSDDSVGMMWGDVGTLYFWIRKQDAEAADFSNVWLVLQCG